MNDIAILDISRKDLITATVPNLKTIILESHSPAEAIAKLDYIQRLLAEVDKSIRIDLLPTMDGSYTLDAYNRFDIRRQKKGAKWQYIDATHQKMKAKRAELDEQIKEVEKELQKQGRAIDENADQYTIVLTERKLTIKPKDENNGTKH